MLDGLVLGISARASLTEAAERYASHLEEAASFLAGRGVSEEVARMSRLGCVVDPAPGHERFAGWVSLPYVTDAGVVAFKFRCQGEHDCKAVKCQRYDSPPGQKARLFNARACSDGGPVVVVCEGELDALVGMSQLGVPCVGTPGTTFLEHWARVFGDFDRVVVVADHDSKSDGTDPGLKHAKKVLADIRKVHENVDLVLPPAGADLGEWIADKGAETVREAMGL